MKAFKTIVFVVCMSYLISACGAVGNGSTVGKNNSGVTSGTTEPTVSSTNPSNGLTNVAINSAIGVTFSTSMDPSTLNGSTFTLSSSAGTVSGTVICAGLTASFTPSSSLMYNTTYTGTVTTGAKNASGDAITANYIWIFTTGSTADATPPIVSSTSPENTATGVSVNSAITTTLSENMDVSTITNATFTLKQGSTPVSGTVAYTGTSATFTPLSNLSYDATYTATITAGVKDAAGNAMLSDYSWSFKTTSTAQMGGSIQGPQLNLTNTVTTIAGSAGFSGSNDAIGTAARFYRPLSITSDGANLFIADMQNNTIRKIEIATGAVSTLAGTAGTSGSADGIGSAARFHNPMGITTDGANLYLSDSMNNTIRKIVIGTGAVSTLAGTAGTSGSIDLTGAAARFSIPRGITTDGTNLFVADNKNYKIRQIVISTGVVTTLAGSGSFGSTDAIGSAASFTYPYGITTDGKSLFVTDWSAIRKIDISTSAVTTIAGTASYSGSADGIGAAARFNQPTGIATDGTNIYVADYANDIIRKVVIATGAVTTIAGSAGHRNSLDGIGSAANFYAPYGITTDGTNLFVAEYCNTIRKIQ